MTTPLEAARWFRARISHLVHGEMTGNGIRPITKKAQIERFLSGNGFRPQKPRIRDIGNHVSTREQRFFAGNERPGEPSVAAIDIDVHGRGSKEGAVAFLERLKTIPVFRDLAWEHSRNGLGIHAYFAVDKEGFSAQRTNLALEAIATYLSRLAREWDADISGVEIIGYIPEIKPQPAGRRTIDFGQMGKMPLMIGTEEGADALVHTTVLTVRQMFALEASNRPQARLRPTRSGAKKGESPAEGPQPAPTPPCRPLGTPTPTGSLSAPPMPSWLTEAIQGPLLELARLVIPETFRTRDDRRIVAPEDIAMGVACFYLASLHPNPDGSMPQARIRAIWKKAIEDGVTSRPWDHDRWAAIRGLLTALGWVDWVDNRYTVGVTVNGTYLKGKACKFHASESLMAIVDRIRQMVEHPTPQAAGTGTRETQRETLGALLPPGFVRRGGGHLEVWRFTVKCPVRAGFVEVPGVKAG